MTLGCNNIADVKDKPLCPVIDCNEIGIHKLRFNLVNKEAYFCTKHKKELEECGLISAEINLESIGVSN